jgi:hypothetical protein
MIFITIKKLINDCFGFLKGFTHRKEILNIRKEYKLLILMGHNVKRHSINSNLFFSKLQKE